MGRLWLRRSIWILVPGLCVAWPRHAGAGTPEPLPSGATSVALVPVPPAGSPAAWTHVTAGLIQDRTRLRASYELYQCLSVTAGGRYGFLLPWRFFSHVGLGAELTLLEVLAEEVSVPPAIQERHARAGLGVGRLWVSSRIVKERLAEWVRLEAGLWLRAHLPTTTLVHSEERYPQVPWRLVLGPNSSRAALLELPGLGAWAEFWGGWLSLGLAWVPLVWGVVGGAEDRFLTHLALTASSRVWQGSCGSVRACRLDLGADLLLLAAMSSPVYTDDVNSAAVGLGGRFSFPPFAVGAAVRYGFGTPATGYGEWTGTLEFRYAFAGQSGD